MQILEPVTSPNGATEMKLPERTLSQERDIAARAKSVQPRQRKARERKSGESQPKSNRAAVSTPIEVNYLSAVKQCAGKKVSEGESYVSRKGKSHLKALVCENVASQIGLSKAEAKNLPEDVLGQIDQAIVLFFSQLGADIAREYDDIKVRTQFAFDRIRKLKGEDGTETKVYEFGQAATMRGERGCRDVSESRRVLNVLVQKHKKRMDFMLEHKDDPHPETGIAPRFSQSAMKAQAERIACTEAALAQLPEFEGAVTPDTPRDIAAKYQRK